MRFSRGIPLPPRGRRARIGTRPALERLEGRELPAPLAPTGLAAAGVSASAIALTWNPSADPTVTGYDVYEKVWFAPPHGGKGSPTGGHYVFNLLASNLHATSDTVGVQKAGSYHTYFVTAVAASGQSPYSLPATGESWAAPSFLNGPTIFLLSGGAVWSGPVAATAGLTTQVSLLVGGNPLTFSVLSGPKTVSIDPKTGVVLYTPAAGEVGTVAVTFKASDPLGSITQTIQFNVAAPNTKLATPTLKLNATSSTYSGTYQQVSATAFGTDGVTRINGTYAIAYNGLTGSPIGAGTYRVLVTFTSYDPKYANATLLGNFTIAKASPTFSSLGAPTIAVGAASTVVSGHVGAGAAVPVGDYVIMTLGGVSQEATVDANGNFASTFATSALAAGLHAITYTFPGDSNFNAAPKGVAALDVVPLSPPTVTVNPGNRTVAVGDPVVFTAAAVGSPVLSVQWQVSTDGGKTFTNITGNTSAQTTTLVFTTYAGQTGTKYRAVFTNSAGVTMTSIATLTVEVDTGGGD